MGYPKRYVGHYHNLAQWLVRQGHAVYPMEMVCQPVIHRRNFIVDVVSFLDEKLYAWEYKSVGDSLSKALLQVENYRESFDYVNVATEDAAQLDWLVRKKQRYVKTLLKDLGAGIYWWDLGSFKLIETPVLQKPRPQLHDDLMKRFKRYVFQEGKRERKRKEELKHNYELTQFMY